MSKGQDQMIQMSRKDCDLLTERLTFLLNENARLENENQKLEDDRDHAKEVVEHQMTVINLCFVKINKLEGKVHHTVVADNGDEYVRPKGPGFN